MQENAPLVSVIVPVYNGERFLGAALESIFAQDYRPLEVVVIDDGSVDGTAGVAQSFPEICYIHQHNQGPAAARNAGIAIARGEFIAFLDHDDLMVQSRLTRQVGYLQAHPEVGYVLGRQEVFFEEGTAPPAWLKRDRLLGDLGGVQPLSGVVRRSVLEAVGAFDPAYRVSEDMDWLFRLRAAGVKIAVIDEVVLRRRIHAANLSSQNPTTPETWFRSLKRKMEQERSKGPVE